MPQRVSKNGSYRIDRRFGGVRIRRASGATTPEGFEDRIMVLNHLRERGRLDILHALRDGKFTVTEVYAAFCDGPEALRELLHGPPSDPLATSLALNLWDTLKAWTPKVRKGHRLPRATTVKRYRVSFRQLRNRTCRSMFTAPERSADASRQE